jgi:hypothetical protein
MKRIKNAIWLTCAAGLLVACGAADNNYDDKSDDASVPPVAAKSSPAAYESPGAARGPFEIDYEIIGTPIVGNPVVVQLRLVSTSGPRPIHLEYNINDASSMSFAEAQPQSIDLEPAANEDTLLQRVSIIPQKEGRIYLNVNASFESADGTVSTITAIPIHVGQVSTAPIEHGEIQVSEDGDEVRVLSSD